MIEQMMNSLCRSMGMEPEEFKEQVLSAYEAFKELSAAQSRIEKRLERIERLLDAETVLPGETQQERETINGN